MNRLYYLLFIVAVSLSFSAGTLSAEETTYDWKGSLSIGADVRTGNTDSKNASVGAEAAKRRDRNRYTLQFLHSYAEEDSNVTARNTYGAGKYDYFATEKLFVYVSLELLNDEFKDLDLRTVIGPGVGYQIWDDKVKSLLVEGGISYFMEDRMEGDDDEWATGRLAGNFGYIFNELITFSDGLIIYPSLEDSGEYNLRNEAVLKTALAANWSLRLAHIFERDSDPVDGVEKDDSQLLLGLNYTFAR